MSNRSAAVSASLAPDRGIRRLTPRHLPSRRRRRRPPIDTHPRRFFLPLASSTPEGRVELECRPNTRLRLNRSAGDNLITARRVVKSLLDTPRTLFNYSRTLRIPFRE